ncbi:hypothetical protein GOODEAATRI_001812 [Goodea atripinnis]|uniref:Uncharacterized protein n=1 Tax=Goodea atripinnis TaxID=208336 RepID=A0ABV0NGU2_9TELE
MEPYQVTTWRTDCAVNVGGKVMYWCIVHDSDAHAQIVLHTHCIPMSHKMSRPSTLATKAFNFSLLNKKDGEYVVPLLNVSLFYISKQFPSVILYCLSTLNICFWMSPEHLNHKPAAFTGEKYSCLRMN